MCAAGVVHDVWEVVECVCWGKGYCAVVWGDGRFWWRVCDARAVCVIVVVMVGAGGDMW